MSGRKPKSPQDLSDLLKAGVTHHEAGRLSEAVAVYDEILGHAPHHADTLYLRGAAAYQLGDDAGADEWLTKAISVNPTKPIYHYQRGVVRQRQGRLEESRRDLEAAIRLQPTLGDAQAALATVCLALADPRAAMAALDSAVRLGKPDSSDQRYAIGVRLHEEGEFQAAIEQYRLAIGLARRHPLAQANLASALRSFGRLDDAILEGRRAVEQDAESDLAWINLGNAQTDQGDLVGAMESYRTVALRRPSDWLARLRVARVCPLIYPSTDEIRHWRGTFERTLDELAGETRRVDLAQLSTSGCEPPFNLAFHGLDDRPIKEKYARLFAGWIPETQRRKDPVRQPPHVGIVVTDGNETLFVRSMMGIVNRLHSDKLRATICCSRRGRPLIEKSLTHRDVGFLELPSRFDHAAEAMREGGFDLIYYWEIATDSLNYFLPFSRVATAQCTSWGIQVTSGNEAIDFYLSSGLMEQEDAQRQYTERLVLMDSLPSYQERRTVPGAAERGEFGLSKQDHVYACVQNLGKFHPDFDEALEGILTRDDKAKVVAGASRQTRTTEQLRSRLRRRLGPLAERILFLPPMPPERYHRLLSVSDVMLDPFPFGGVNTTYDGLSLGLPIVTYPGAFQRGRFALACYRRMGLEDFVATSVDAYIERAVRWGTDAEERRGAVHAIHERSGEVFENPACVEALQDALVGLFE